MPPFGADVVSWRVRVWLAHSWMLGAAYQHGPQESLDTLNAMSYDDVHTRRAGNGMARGAARVCPGWRRLCGEGIALNDA